MLFMFDVEADVCTEKWLSFGCSPNAMRLVTLCCFRCVETQSTLLLIVKRRSKDKRLLVAGRVIKIQDPMKYDVRLRGYTSVKDD